MFFVLLVHAAALEVLAFPLPQLGLLFLPIALGAVFLSAAHFANVIEETGPEDRDELPRFLRDLNFAEDIWLPFCACAGGDLLFFARADRRAIAAAARNR